MVVKVKLDYGCQGKVSLWLIVRVKFDCVMFQCALPITQSDHVAGERSAVIFRTYQSESNLCMLWETSFQCSAQLGLFLAQLGLFDVTGICILDSQWCQSCKANQVDMHTLPGL